MRGEVRFLSTLLIAVALCGCKTVPLTGDPTAPARDAKVSPPLLYKVEWWNTLVRPPLLEFSPAEHAAPAVDPDTERIFTGTRDGIFRCLSPIDGKVEWEKKISGKFFAGAMVRDGIVYVPGGDGILYALKSRTGEQVWQYKSGEELVTTPVYSGGKILVATQSDGLIAINGETGEWVWQYRRDSPSGFSVRGAAAPVVYEGVVYAGFADGYLAAVGLADGVAKWERKLTTSGGNQFLDVDSPVVVDSEGTLFAASYKDGVFALNSKTGDQVWQAKRPGVTSLLNRGDVVFTSGDGQLSALHARTGRELWSLELSEKGGKKGTNAGHAPILAGREILIPTSTALVFVDPSSGRAQVAWNPGRGITATPVRLGTRLYVLSNLGTLFAVRLKGSGW